MRISDYETRRNEVLATTVELYLNHAAPIGSDILHQTRKFDCSPATLRNVLADLEDLGYLTHPHTSAGRIPTDKGYRYYIDFIMEKSNLAPNEQAYLRKICEYRIKSINDILEEVSRLVSDLTHYASLIYLTAPESKLSYGGLSYILDQPEFNNVLKARAILNLLEKRDKLLDLVEREFEGPSKVYIGKESECEEIKDCSLVISRTGKKKGRKGKLGVLGPKRMAYKKVIPLVDYLSELMDEIWERF
jgi:heat-inducible transcriptional repressor